MGLPLVAVLRATADFPHGRLIEQGVLRWNGAAHSDTPRGGVERRWPDRPKRKSAPPRRPWRASGAWAASRRRTARCRSRWRWSPAGRRKPETERQAVEAALSRLPGVTSAAVVLTAERAAAPPPPGAGGSRGQGRIELPGVSAVVAVASGKGGVGKSTVAVQSRRGARPAGPRRWPDGQRHLRALAAAHDGHFRQARAGPRQDAAADAAMGRGLHVDRLPGLRGDGDDLARARW